MIRNSTYKNRPAVVVEGDNLRATFLPKDGGKMASLQILPKEKELLLVKGGEEYKVLQYGGDYVSSECSAFDDMCPTIDPYTPTSGAYKGVTYPDHGEACRLSYDVTVDGDAVTFTAESRLFPLTYSKTVRAKNGGLEIDYRVQNRGEQEIPFLWAGHIMLLGEDGMVLTTPFEKDAETEFCFCTKGYDTALLPKDRLTGFLPEKGAAYKFYYTQKIKEGKFSLSYSDGSVLTFTYDGEKVPYLGVWLNNGEFQDIYNIAPEPCSLPFDAPHKAAERGYTGAIPPGETFGFIMNITLK